MQRLLREGRYQQCIAAIRIDDPFSAANNELVEVEFIQDDADVKGSCGRTLHTGKCICAVHLQLTREDWKRCYMRKPLATWKSSKKGL